MTRLNAVQIDKTAMYVLSHGWWRALMVIAMCVVPFYAWIQFYYFSTGAWNQPAELVASNAPLLATFFFPLIIATWLAGFNGRHIFIGAIVGAIIAGWTSPSSMATQLIPHGYINLGIILVLLTISWHSFCYWRAYRVHKLPVSKYTNGAYAVVTIAVVALLILLLPIKV